MKINTMFSIFWAVICKSGNGESGNAMRRMEVVMQEIGVGMWGIWMGIRGLRERMRGIGVGNVGNRIEIEKK